MTSSPHLEPMTCKGILKGHRDHVSNVDDFSRVSDVCCQIVCRELIRYSRYNLPPERRLSEDPAILGSLPVELVIQVEIAVPVFQESEVYHIHRAQCTRALHFSNQASCNNLV